MKNLDINKIEKINCIQSELQYEEALAIYKKLRWMIKDNPSLKLKRDHLRALLLQYEKDNWSNDDTISDEQIEESDIAERIVQREEEFIFTRKVIIKEKLSSIGLNQQELGKILGHRKNYMSELINGVRPFSKNDLVIIHKLLKIPIEKLLPTFIETEMINRINTVLEELNIERLKLDETDLVAS